MPTPLASILLPVFNAGATLEACLRSVARQSHSNWECVLVDDGSTDASLTIARETARRDPRFRVIKAPHRGIVATLEHGLTSCRAPFIARMDADDLMHRERLATQLDALAQHPEWSAVGCGVRIFPRRTLRDGMRNYEQWLNSLTSAEEVTRDAYIECPVAHPTLMIRGEVLRQVGYCDSPWPEDYDLVLRLLASGHRLSNVSGRLLLWRESAARLSRTDPRYAQHAFTACKAEHLARGFLADFAEYVLWGYGATGRALADALESHRKRPSAIVEVHPRRIGNRIRNAPVIPPDALPAWRGVPLLVSVAGAGPRAQIRSALSALGYTETVDYLVAA